MRNDTVKFEYTDDEGAEQEGELPGKFEVCSRCQGHGTHCNPNIDGNGITSSEWAEWDEESREMYLSGGYDVTCEACHGARVTLEIDRETCERNPDLAALLKRYDDIQDDLAEMRSIERMEMMAEMGMRYFD